MLKLRYSVVSSNIIRRNNDCALRRLVDIGAGKAVDTTTIKDPVIGFIFGQKRLMYNLTLEGAKFTKLDKKWSRSRFRDVA